MKWMVVPLALWLVARVEGLAPDPCTEGREACERAMSLGQRRQGRVCGSDNVTYDSECGLEAAACRGAAVERRHGGRCRGHQPCTRDLQRLQGRTARGSFVPRCLPDGRYAAVQCHEGTGYCWCVTPQGRPVPNTSRRHHRPNCSRRFKTRRRASPRKSDREWCDRSDKLRFNENLVNLFRAEYGRAVEETPQVKDKILGWKFDSMDLDGDGFLKRPEYRLLRKLKKLVRPKKCAKTFAKVCDLDRDLRLSKEEWLACLGPSAQGQLRGTTVPVASLSGQLPGLEASPGRKEEPEATDCFSDRQAVLAEQRGSELYVPECEQDGRYSRIQCYRSTGYCWCVHEDDGKPIPGTSVKDQQPRCDAIPLPVRPMKGCPGDKKAAFLKDLAEFLSARHAARNGSRLPADRVPAASFAALDANGNKHLERKEWKAFRALVAGSKALRRCGKRLPRYCDVNSDRRISLTEWTHCLRGAGSHAPSAAPPLAATAPPHAAGKSKRRGPNPLESYLKDDD